MYIIKDGKFYKETLQEVDSKVILDMLNKQDFEKNNIQENNTDYKEICGFKVCTKDLDRPRNPEVYILKFGENYDYTKPYAIDNGYGQWLYNWQGAMIEAEYRGLRLPTDEEFTKIEKEIGYKGFVNMLGLKDKKDYPGYCYAGSCYYRGYRGYRWSSSAYDSTSSRRRYLYYSYASVCRYNDTSTYAFSVRCFKD